MYIYEKENWTNFFWDSNKLSPILASVRHLQGRLLGRMESLGFDFIESATLESLILDVVDTSRIESKMNDQYYFTILNSSGIVIQKSSVLYDGIYDIDLSAIPSGVYFIRFDYLNSANSIVRKIVKL